MRMRALTTGILAAAWLTLALPAFADGTATARPVLLDRVVVRWHAPETGGVARPQFIFERELAFEARIEAFADPDPDPAPYTDRHVRAALDRHIAETLLASLPVTPEPETPDEIAKRAGEIARRAESARAVLEQRTGGRENLIAAAKAEGIGSDEIDALLRRQARASLYLDRMVAPMLEPSDPELRAIQRTGTTPFTSLPYEKIAPALKRWVVGQRLGQAITSFYQTARSRVVVTIVRPR
ncbi:hypothetical protein [Polyangium aurulentum]|uniref:hypothetical protein n=1 Tax=Polyangium aurulentum TaxID=2567896 RepID=UPI0010AE5765|nr:hypothetical protein [Polyangium aurulentum]UQA60957.1 hypothetical protein E8A73_010955 [Polyangium aurulentum]